MQAMREAGMFCDATVIVEGITFPVHRVVIAAGSEVLAAMFAAGFLETLIESKHNVVTTYILN